MGKRKKGGKGRERGEERKKREGGEEGKGEGRREWEGDTRHTNPSLLPASLSQSTTLELPTLSRISSSTRPDSSKTLALYKSFTYLLTSHTPDDFTYTKRQIRLECRDKSVGTLVGSIMPDFIMSTY